MSDLLKKKDVTEAVGAAKTTVHDWIKEFAPFIPTVKNGQTTYYKPEAVDVLREIKKLREQGFDKTQIAMELPGRGFAVNAEEIELQSVQEVKSQVDQSTNRDALMTVMQSMAVAMERMTELEREVQETKEQNKEIQKRNEELANQVEKQEKYIEEQVGRRDKRFMEVMREIQEAKEQVAAVTEEQKNKSFFSRLFGK